MKKEYLIINSNCDDLPISLTIFTPEDHIKGIFQIAHGMAEHKERYYEFMEYIANQGYIAVINDHRGHGKSILDKEDLGYFYEENAEFIVEDLHQITLYIKDLHPNKHVTLFGHSMGSMIVRKYIKKYDNDVNKLIVCGSPSKNNFVDLALLVTKKMTKEKGDRYRSELLHKLAVGNLNNKVKDNEKSSHAWLSTNRKNVQKFDKDKLCGFIFTLNGFKNLFTLMKEIYDKNNWRLDNTNMPIFFIAGSNDPVIISKRKWNKSQEFLRKLGYTNVSGKLYEGFRHEILNEKNNKEVYEDIISFLK